MKILVMLLLLVLISGCIRSEPEIENLKLECIRACQNAIENNLSLEDGPCLLDPMQNQEWVCDVAHDPRQPVDNKKENQCDAWHRGIAKHFIEVTPECKFIRAI